MSLGNAIAMNENTTLARSRILEETKILVENLIVSSMDKGSYDATLDTADLTIKHEIIEWLKKLGYQVTPYTESIYISWSKK